MRNTIELGGITLDVVRKDIKNVHLSVYPPTGRVRITAPSRMSRDTIRLFAISKLGWIKRQQRKLREQQRESQREYLDGESHYVWGKRYLLKLIEEEAAPSVQIHHGNLILRVRRSADHKSREAVVAGWYRQLVRTTAQPLVEYWEPRLKVNVKRLFVQKMKTKWGSCNPVAHTIRLNTELAKKPKECLKYIIVHELVHLLERHHGDRFAALMERHLPSWKAIKAQLAREPLGHEQWDH